MTKIAPTLETYFTDRLANQRQASPHTVTAYRDTFKLLVSFVHDRSGTSPSKLGFEHLDAAAPMVNRAGKQILRFPARWPWAHTFNTTLATLRTLDPIPI